MTASAAISLSIADLRNAPQRDERPVEHREQRQLAEIGIGARAELQRRGLARDADVHRKLPEPLQDVQQPRLRRKRDRRDDEVDAFVAGEIGEFLRSCRSCGAGDRFGAALIVAVVEDADDLDVDIARTGRGAMIASSADPPAADDGDAAAEAARLCYWLGPCSDGEARATYVGSSHAARKRQP